MSAERLEESISTSRKKYSGEKSEGVVIPYIEGKMSIEWYQEQSKRTNAALESPLMDNLHMLLGMQTEVAEIADVFKKHMAYGKEIDWVNVKEEIGDCLFYVANMCNINGWDLRDILETNINKLKHRYPEKFEAKFAFERDLEGERKILEK